MVCAEAACSGCAFCGTNGGGSGNGGTPAQLPDDLEEPNTTNHEPLCSNDAVEEACLLINNGPDGPTQAEPGKDAKVWTSFSRLAHTISAPEERLNQIFEDLNETVNECRSICEAIVSSIDPANLPEVSDVACYFDGSGHRVCDLDASQAQLTLLFDKIKDETDSLKHADPKGGDDDSNNTTTTVPGNGGADPAAMLIQDYTDNEIVVAVASLFRIYPALEPIETLEGEDRDLEPPQVEALEKVAAYGRALTAMTIRKFRARDTEVRMTYWFGDGTYRDENARDKVRLVMNSARRVLGSLHIEKGSPGACGVGPQYASIYAYAETCRPEIMFPMANVDAGKGNNCEMNGKFFVYLCQAWIHGVSAENAVRLLHEATHHRKQTIDHPMNGPIYGRHHAHVLAGQDSPMALKTAENYKYYVLDVSTDPL